MIMPNNPIEYTVEKLFNVFLKEHAFQDNAHIKDKNFNKRAIIRTRSFDFANFGEFEIMKSPKIWHNTIKELGLPADVIDWQLITHSNDENAKDRGIYAVENLYYPMKNVKILPNQMNVFLVRDVTIKKLLNAILYNVYEQNVDIGVDIGKFGHSIKDPNSLVYIEPAIDENVNGEKLELSIYRANVVRDVLAKVLVYTKWTQVVDYVGRDDVLRIEVCSVASKDFNEKMNSTKSSKNIVRIICGLVTDLATKKASEMSYDEYVALRCNDMCLAAMHKYGVRDTRYTSLPNTLGRAAVPIDFLEVKHSSPVHTKLNGVSNTKGIVFILYNMARCDGLLREFEERVTKKRNITLPQINEIDFTLLKLEEEWSLVFNYMFSFPRLLNRCVEQLAKGVFGAHSILQFLSSLVADFSVYYHRYRILTDTRDELMPLMFARMYLVKGLREILVTALSLFDIEPIEIM